MRWLTLIVAALYHWQWNGFFILYIFSLFIFVLYSLEIFLIPLFYLVKFVIVDDDEALKPKKDC